MKAPIATLEDVLSLALGTLYDAEEKIGDRLPLLCVHVQLYKTTIQ